MKQAINWRWVTQMGFYAGLATFFMGVVGMIEEFTKKKFIADIQAFRGIEEGLDAITLGQVLIVAAPFAMSYFVVQRLRKQGHGALNGLLAGLLVGLLAMVLPVLLTFLPDIFENIRDMFVNISKGLVETMTFELEALNRGRLLLAAFTMLAALLGATLGILPDRVRKPLLNGLLWAVGIAVMSELLKQMLGQIEKYEMGWDRDQTKQLLKSGSVRPGFFIGIFVVTTLLGFVLPLIRRPYKSWLGSTSVANRKAINWVSFALLMALLCILPWISGRFLSDVYVTVGLYVLMGLGLNIAVGQAGLLDLGYLTNFAVGAYLTAVLTSTGPIGYAAQTGNEMFNFWLIIPISIVSAMMTGFFFSLPVLRMRGDYLAIATLGFGEIIGKLLISDALKERIGGPQGILFIPKPTIFGYELANPEQLYYVVLAACLLMLFVSLRLNDSRTGRQWMAIREDEDVAASMGIDTTRTKVIAFTLSAAAGGLAGAIFATKVGTVFPQSFTILVSINVLSLIIVGGMGSVPGIIVGAMALVGLPEILREFSEFRFLIFGALLVVMMLVRPEGLWPSKIRRQELGRDDEDVGDILEPAVGD